MMVLLRRAGFVGVVSLGLALTMVLTAAVGTAHRAGAGDLIKLRAYALPGEGIPWICRFGGGERDRAAPPTACAFGIVAVAAGLPPIGSALSVPIVRIVLGDYLVPLPVLVAASPRAAPPPARGPPLARLAS